VCTLSALADVVRKLIYGDVDLGIVGLDMLAEIGNDDPGAQHFN
jgi:ATP phosphoribosyltransferase